MIAVFNGAQLFLGTFAATVNPLVARGATAAAENINEIIFQIETSF